MMQETNDSSAMDREIPPFLITYAFEVDFFVAQKKPDTNYNPYDSDTDSGNDKAGLPRPAPWACPADSPDPLASVLGYCKDVLVHGEDAVTVYFTPNYDPKSRKEFNTRSPGLLSRFESWAVAPSDSACQLPGLPSAYNWIGVKLQTPLLPEAELSIRHSPLKQMMGALRANIRMAVNSSCGVRVILRPDGNPLNLLMAKKIASLVWVLEKDLLSRLCPIKNFNDASTSVSVLATKAPEDIAQSRPADPLVACIMDQNIPRLIKMRARVQVQHIWAQKNIDDFEKSLQARDESGSIPSAFSLQSFDSHDDTPVLAFRYGVWHPYDTLDTTEHWVRLSICLLRATQLSPLYFRGFVGSLDGIIHGWEDGTPEGELWQVLLSRLGMSDSVISDWARIRNAYADGEMLAKDVVDGKGRLPRSRDIGAACATQN